MGKTLIAIIVGIFVTGFIAGIFVGASIKTGEDVDPDSQIVNVLGIFCNSIKDIDTTGQAYSTCRTSFIMLSLIVIVVGILEIIATASQLENFWVGLSIYGFGFFIGLILIIAN